MNRIQIVVAVLSACTSIAMLVILVLMARALRGDRPAAIRSVADLRPKTDDSPPVPIVPGMTLYTRGTATAGTPIPFVVRAVERTEFILESETGEPFASDTHKPRWKWYASPN